MVRKCEEGQGEGEQTLHSAPPGGRIKRLLANSGLLYLRMMLVLLVSLYTSRVVLRELGVVDYGIYNVVGGFVALVGFLSAALSQTTQRFLAFEMGQQNGRLETVFSTAVAIHLGFALLIYCMGYVAGEWAIGNLLNYPNDRVLAVRMAFQFSLLTFCASIIQVPFHSMVVAQERMHVFAAISVTETLLKLAVAISIPFAVGDRLVHFTGLLFTTSVVALVGYVACSFGVVRASRRQPRWDKALAKAVIGQLGWNLWGNIAAVAGTHGVNLLLNVFFGPAINAARGIAYQVHSALAMFISNVQTAVNPQITKSYSSGDRIYFGKLVSGGAKLYAFIFIATAIPVLLETEYLLTLWLENPPDHAVIFTRLVVITLLSNALSGTLFTAAQASGRVRSYNAILGTISLFNIPLSWLVLKAGAAPESTLYVSLALAAIMLPVRVFLVGRVTQISPRDFMRQVLLPVFAIAAVVCCFAVIPIFIMEPSFVRAVVTAAVTAVSLIGAAYFFGLSMSEKQLVKVLIESSRKRLRPNGISAKGSAS